MVHYVHFPDLTERLLIFLWLGRVIFTAILMFLTTLENGSYRVYVLSFRNRQFGVTKPNVFRVGCPNILCFALS